MKYISMCNSIQEFTVLKSKMLLMLDQYWACYKYMDFVFVRYFYLYVIQSFFLLPATLHLSGK